MLLKTVNEWITLLASAGVPCGRIRTVEEVCANPQLTERNKVVVQPHPTIDSLKMIGLPIELSETPGRIDRPPPLLGEQTNIVLKEAGYSDAEVQNFRARGIV